MEIIVLTHYLPNLQKGTNCFALKLIQSKEIWLFNCIEGCQHILVKKNIKINHISKIILTELHVNNISGLIGLLSSLHLVGRTQDIHIYSQKEVKYYIEIAKKYSQTNFKYNIYTHRLYTGLIIQNQKYKLYTFTHTSKFIFSMITKELNGIFRLSKAKTFNLIQGPLYGKLKADNYFLLPDGSYMKGQDFKYNNKSGSNLAFINYKYHYRNSYEISNQSILLK
uniref:Rnz n=1 Tax=Pterocladia lucida TaxID=31408 RepID=A0A6M3WVR5_PTELU|nr:rnz [Pterocladia lucida]